MTSMHAWTKLAEYIAHRLEITERSRVSIFVNANGSVPAADALIRTATLLGAEVQTVYTSESADAVSLSSTEASRLLEPAPLEKYAMEWCDVHVSFRAMLWPESDAPTVCNLPERLSRQRTAKGVISSMRWKRTRWTIVRIPTESWAERIDVPFDTLMREFFAGAYDDWDANRVRWQSVADALTSADVATITSPDTQLTLGLRGRRGILFAGKANIPDGEAATAPADDDVNGHITFPGTSIFAGQIFEDVRLDFKQGQVVDVRAKRGASIARSLIATDGGSRRVGELGIGLSTAVQTWTGDLFIDEKILGTVHIALGRAYPDCGGVNQSSLHWDIVKDLRRTALSGSGTFTIGGVPLIENGVVVWPSLAG